MQAGKVVRREYIPKPEDIPFVLPKKEPEEEDQPIPIELPEEEPIPVVLPQRVAP